jgi:selenide,water dikinase
MNHNPIRLTQYSHGAGCGCKIAPDVLSQILGRQDQSAQDLFPSLLVGNDTRDDAAAVRLDDGKVVLSTTDFFMPIVDDPYDFGRIAATNAISDIYAMGGTPIMAIAILGWPVGLLGPDIANQVVQGGRDVCHSLGFALAGGHSIDAPEPIFGLAVTGVVAEHCLKKNNAAREGDLLLLTKPLGIGIHTTAEKQAKLSAEHAGMATALMCQPNDIGATLSALDGIHAMTDVTGFGLAGHLIEICEGAQLTAFLKMSEVPELPALNDYIAMGCVPGGTERNHVAYQTQLPPLSLREKAILCDPQTSGGLLIAVASNTLRETQQLLINHGLPASVIGELSAPRHSGPLIQFTTP